MALTKTNLENIVEGILPIANGGTGTSTFPNGATVTSSATDVTLTNTSNQVQQIAMTAFGKNVILPDATTFTTTGGPKFIISNNGAIAFDVAASGSGRFFGLAPGQTVEISLSSISTATGGWVATPTSVSQSTPFSAYSNTNLLSYTVTAYNSTNSFASVYGTTLLPYNYSMTCTALSTTAVLVTWIAPSTGYVNGVVGTISGTTITWGAVTTINSARVYTTAVSVALSSTTALVCMQNAGAAMYWIGLSISGTTITPGTISATDSASQVCGIAVANSTTVVRLTANGTNMGLRAVVYNGASAPTFGTAITGPGTTNNNGYTGQIVALNSTTFLIAYDNSSTFARCYTLAGTTLTAGAAAVTLNVTSSSVKNLIYVSATEAVFVTGGGWQKLTISGTTITLGSYGTTTYIWNSGVNGLLYAIGTQLVGTTDFIGVNYTSEIARYSYNSSLGTVTTKGISLCSNSLLTVYACSVSSTQALVVGLTLSTDGNNNYYPAGYLVALNG